jgi:hypothetical protein
MDQTLSTSMDKCLVSANQTWGFKLELPKPEALSVDGELKRLDHVPKGLVSMN